MGCAWLLDRWGELRNVLEQGQKWRAPDRFKAIRLLGRQPLDMDEDDRVMAIYLNCSAMEPPEGLTFKDLGNELHWNEQKRFNEWAGQRGVLGRIPADAETGKAALLELAGEEEGRLEERLATLLEGPEPSGAEWAFDASDAAERLRRYQATCDRSLLRVLEALRKRRREAPATGRSGQRSARPTNEVADPTHGISGLLSLLQAVRDRGRDERTFMPRWGNPPHENGVGPSYARRGPALGVRPSLALVCSTRERTWPRPRLDFTSEPALSPPDHGGARRGNCSTPRGRPTGPDRPTLRSDRHGHPS